MQTAWIRMRRLGVSPGSKQFDTQITFSPTLVYIKTQRKLKQTRHLADENVFGGLRVKPQRLGPAASLYCWHTSAIVRAVRARHSIKIASYASTNCLQFWKCTAASETQMKSVKSTLNRSLFKSRIGHLLRNRQFFHIISCHTNP